MATPKVKSTYSLGIDAVAALDRLATEWGTTRTEALRRAISRAADAEMPATDALDRLQAAAALDPRAAREAAARTRRARLAGSTRRERR